MIQPTKAVVVHRSRKLAVLTAACVLAAGGTTAIAVEVMPTGAASAPSESVARDDGSALPPSFPVSIDIPAIGVRSPLQRVGLTDENIMQVPAPGPHYNEAAWYKHSVGPGSPGPAIIVGHVDSAAQGPSVFFDLADLRPGDDILVARADGLTARFRVDTVGRYAKADFPTSLVYGHTDRAELRLITCGGAFDGAAGHYLDNVVVFATLVGHR
ncbi:MAG: class F sortase [Egibacteraceae bacterium]